MGNGKPAPMLSRQPCPVAEVIMILRAPLAIDNGILTPTMKIHRERVEEIFDERAADLAGQSAEQSTISIEWA